MRAAFICTPVRTAVGAFGGMFRDIRVQTLAATVVSAVVEQAGVDPGVIDEVVLGQGYPNGEAPALGRVAALDAGMPVSVPGLQVDRRCGSGLQAVLDAAMHVQTGMADLVVAGGAESMSGAEHYVLGARWGLRTDGRLVDRLARGRVTAGGANHPVPGGMIETAENLRSRYAISRDEQDDLAFRSQERAGAAIRSGLFEREIVPVVVEDRRRGLRQMRTDEHPRLDIDRGQLRRLTPIMAGTDPSATVTAGNASGQNDGAAACLVASEAAVARLGLVPMARLVSWAVAGVEPELMGLGPVPATQFALARAGLNMDDMDVIELNEAFAAQVLAVLAEWKVESTDGRLNPNGSGISLGHPIGATGTRILVTLLHEMERRGARYGLETMCIGGGQGIAAIFQRE